MAFLSIFASLTRYLRLSEFIWDTLYKLKTRPFKFIKKYCNHYVYCVKNGNTLNKLFLIKDQNGRRKNYTQQPSSNDETFGTFPCKETKEKSLLQLQYLNKFDLSPEGYRSNYTIKLSKTFD